MKWGYIMVVWGLFALSGHAQSELAMSLNREGKITFIPKKQSYRLEIPEFSYDYKRYERAATPDLDARLRTFIPQLSPRFEDRPMDRQILSTAYKPFFEVYLPMVRRVSPMALDFNETVVAPVDQNFSLFVNGQQNTWPGAGGNTFLTGGVAWSEGRWSVATSAFGGRFFTPFNPSPGFMGGVNMDVRFEVTDWMAMRLWGQYANYQGNSFNSFVLLNPSYQHTSVGTAFEFKVTDTFGVGMGINYEYNPFRRKMDRQIMVYPIFRR